MGFIAVPYLFVCGFCFCECFRCLGGCVGFYGSWQFEGAGGGLVHGPWVGGSDPSCMVLVVWLFAVWE